MDMMSSLASLGAAALAGVAIGVLHFGGLLLTVRKIEAAHHAGRLLALSFILRTGITGLTFFLVMAGSGERLLSCLLGFMVSRSLLSRWCLARALESGRMLKGIRGG